MHLMSIADLICWIYLLILMAQILNTFPKIVLDGWVQGLDNILIERSFLIPFWYNNRLLEFRDSYFQDKTIGRNTGLTLQYEILYR